jgi:hypothetical protein
MQQAARKVAEESKFLQEENQKLRQLLATYGITDAEIEERLKVNNKGNSVRRGSTQTTAITSLMAATTMVQSTDRLEGLLGPPSIRLQRPHIQQHQEDDEDDSEEDSMSPIRSSAAVSGTSKRLSIATQSSRHAKDSLTSPARLAEPTLLSQPSSHSISSSAASTPSIEGQTTSQQYVTTLPDPRITTTRQLVPPAQSGMFGMQAVPQQYTYGIPPQSPWARQAEFSAPVSMYSQPTAYVHTEPGSPINMMAPGMIPSTVGYQQSPNLVTTNNMDMTPMMAMSTHGGGRRPSGQLQIANLGPNIKSDPEVQDRWH